MKLFDLNDSMKSGISVAFSSLDIVSRLNIITLKILFGVNPVFAFVKENKPYGGIVGHTCYPWLSRKRD